jgi:hypothetical protein
MTSRTPVEEGLGWLYDQVTGDEDARVCKDIPDTAGAVQPAAIRIVVFSVG